MTAGMVQGFGCSQIYPAMWEKATLADLHS